MKTIQIDDDLYQFIAANTLQIGESASDILRRLLWENAPSKTTTVSLNKTPKTVNTDQASTNAKSSNAQAAEVLGTDSDGTTESLAVNEVNTTAKTEAVCKDTTVFNLLNKEEVTTQKGAVGRFLFILGKLHRAHNKNFADVIEIKGRERNYFGLSAEELEASGSSIKPKQIPNSEFWVTTNNNTPRKKFIIFEVAKQLGYTDVDAEKLRELI